MPTWNSQGTKILNYKNKTQINKIGKQIYVLIHNKKKEELNNISYLLFDIMISKSNLDNQLGELIKNCIK